MPPKVKFTKEQVVSAAITVVRNKGYQALNARSVAKILGCSTQPVFRVFENMEQLKKAVIQQANAVYNSYIEASKADTEKPYKATGLAYIRFAKEEKELFRLLFMRDRSEEDISKQPPDDNLDYILTVLRQATGFEQTIAHQFHLQMWIYTHGLASMIATNYLDFTEEETSRLLKEAFIALSTVFQKHPEDLKTESRGENDECYH